MFGMGPITQEANSSRASFGGPPFPDEAAMLLLTMHTRHGSHLGSCENFSMAHRSVGGGGGGK